MGRQTYFKQGSRFEVQNFQHHGSPYFNPIAYERSLKIRDMKFFFLLKMAEICRECNFSSEKPFLIIKKCFGIIKYKFQG